MLRTPLRPVNPTDTTSDTSERTSQPPDESASNGGPQVNAVEAAQAETPSASEQATSEAEPAESASTEPLPLAVNSGAVVGDAALGDAAHPSPAPMYFGVDADASGARRSQPVPWLSGTSARRLASIDRRFAMSLWLQGMIATAVLGMWLLGKLSWNHDPLVSQRYRPVEVNVHTSRAQNAALEFHHDLTAGLFGEARLLAAEEAEKLVDDAAAACQPPSPCASQERVYSRATLLSSSGQDARASVETFTRDGKLVSRGAYELSHATGRWLVTARVEP